MAETVFVPLTVGGGVRKVEDIRLLLNAGADKVSINSAAVFNPEFVQEASQRFGAQCIVVAIDAKKTGENKWEIFTHGGRKPTGIDAIEWSVKMADFGAGELLITSMDADGTKAGYDIALMRQINDRVNIPTIASGGMRYWLLQFSILVSTPFQKLSNIWLSKGLKCVFKREYYSKNQPLKIIV
ncbi:hypothetical protein LTR94_019992 [Friedmanniomyces endolithicus]|nr:hypothetical protein LTR94_019992 [Friedmanniomyces endolithicus]